jgi:GNAT superfamily N-acetyltransferase
MTEGDLAFADSLRGMVGWNQTVKDWRRLLDHAPQGCFIAEWDGVPVGTATTTRYGDELAWIGMLLVHPDCRKRGVGQALLEHCLNHLKQTSCIKLDATPLGKALYDKLGFEVEWPLTRWECKCFAESQQAMLAVERAVRGHPVREANETREILAQGFGFEASRLASRASTTLKTFDASWARPLDQIDSRAFGVSRAALVDRLFADSSRALVAVSHDGQFQGYGLLRKGMRASYLGPIVADSSVSGIALINGLLSQTKGQPIYWDVPDVNDVAMTLARELGFAPQRQLIRMYLGVNKHPGDPVRCFAVADPSIG